MSKKYKTGLTNPAIMQLLNMDAALPPVTLDDVKNWMYGRSEPPEERKRQLDKIEMKRKEIEKYFANAVDKNTTTI